MRRAIFLFFLTLGIGFGLLSARNDDWGLRLVMMAVGALFGGAIGGGLSQLGKRHPGGRRLLTEEDIEPIPGGLGTSNRDLAANYWRDEGHPPFMKPPRSEHGTHMFDADKNNRIPTSGTLRSRNAERPCASIHSRRACSTGSSGTANGSFATTRCVQ